MRGLRASATGDIALATAGCCGELVHSFRAARRSRSSRLSIAAAALLFKLIVCYADRVIPCRKLTCTKALTRADRLRPMSCIRSFVSSWFDVML